MTLGWRSWLARPGVVGSASVRRAGKLLLVGIAVYSPNPLSNKAADEDEVADVLHVLQEGITAIRKHPGGDPRMRLEGFLADFVSILAHNKEKSNIEMECLVPHFPRSVYARSSTRSVAGCNQVL